MSVVSDIFRNYEQNEIQEQMEIAFSKLEKEREQFKQMVLAVGEWNWDDIMANGLNRDSLANKKVMKSLQACGNYYDLMDV